MFKMLNIHQLATIFAFAGRDIHVVVRSYLHHIPFWQMDTDDK